MPNPKKPRHLAILDGSAKRNPGRYKTEDATHPDPLAPPPEHLSDAVKNVYLEIAEAALPGVLRLSDSLGVEIAAGLLHEYRRDPANFQAGKLNILTSWLHKLGLTPQSRQQFGIAPEKAPENPFDQF